MLTRTFLLTFGLLLSPLPRGAQEAQAPATAPAAAGQEAIAAARDLVETTGAVSIMQEMLEKMREPMIKAAQQQVPQLPAATVQQAIDEVVMPEIRLHLPEFKQIFTEIYVRHFTADELRGLVAFYATPLGRKSLQVLPQITQESMMAGQRWGQAIVQRALVKHRDELRRRGIPL
jgi:hypothetical protein